jgi:hypothetical protein
LLATLLGIQAIPQLIKGDAKLTLEGNFYGIYMFEANHQCALELSNPDGTLIRRRISTNARFRCDPWPYFSVAKRTYCHADSGDTPIHFRLIHSINGGPFYEIVNAPNLCDLEYRPFTHNTWIKDETTAPIVGRPVKNYYL